MRVDAAGFVVLTCLVCWSALARAASATPSADMLEFLGTYETSSGKEMDPMALSPVADKKKGPVKKVAAKTTTAKRKIKKKTKDGGHE
jgi:hypothetical protein